MVRKLCNLRFHLTEKKPSFYDVHVDILVFNYLRSYPNKNCAMGVLNFLFSPPRTIENHQEPKITKRRHKRTRTIKKIPRTTKKNQDQPRTTKNHEEPQKIFKNINRHRWLEHKSPELEWTKHGVWCFFKCVITPIKMVMMVGGEKAASVGTDQH